MNLRWRSARYMDLGRNHFNGTLDAIDENFAELRLLFLDKNNFTGTIPAALTNTGNGQLAALLVDNNQLTGEVPSEYSYINKLGK
jgi:hypothetical protein